MKKLIFINLAGKAFQIEEDAFQYLEDVLREQLNREAVEKEIAIKMDKLLSDAKTFITYGDVKNILQEMDSPHQSERPYDSQIREFYEERRSTNTKRLYRSTKNRVIAGVCSGIANYFNIDPTLVRALFIVAVFLGGASAWIYILLWIFIPEKRWRS